MRSFLFSSLLLLPALAAASPGIVDEYDCHVGGTDERYHCHGSPDAAQRQHVLIGASVRMDSWHYGNGPANYFAGPGVSGEIAREHLALHGGWHTQAHISGDPGYRLVGWDIGVKFGAGIARLGTHPYGELGYFNQSFSLTDGRQFALSGYQFGVGVIRNWPQAALDARINYRDPSSAQMIWQQLEAPGVNAHLSTQVGIAIRF